jgi:hypothetical protein
MQFENARYRKQKMMVVPLVTADKKILREFPAIAESLDAYGNS